MSDDGTIDVEMNLATAPWFGFCDVCLEEEGGAVRDDLELGWPYPQVVGRIRGEDDWFCVVHLTAKVAEASMAAMPES